VSYLDHPNCRCIPLVPLEPELAPSTTLMIGRERLSRSFCLFATTPPRRFGCQEWVAQVYWGEFSTRPDPIRRAWAAVEGGIRSMP